MADNVDIPLSYDDNDNNDLIADFGDEIADVPTGISNATFKDFNLRDELLTNIKNHGFENPSEVQQQAIPKALSGSDLVVQAKSGMGKTAVFVIATLQDFSASNNIDTLVLANTHELATQIYKEYVRLSTNFTAFKCVVVHGGYNVRKDIQAVETAPNVLVGTPGRVLDLINRNAIDVTKLKHFVLDECDKLIEDIDMRFIIQKIFKRCNKDKQIMMFTATLNDETSEICKKFMQKPEVLRVTEEKRTFKSLKQFFVNVKSNEKLEKVTLLLDQLRFNQAAVYVNSTSVARDVYSYLCGQGFPCTIMYARLDNDARTTNLDDFRNRKTRVLVSTDLTGRGIDVDAINLVINYEMPLEAPTYQHRVGRAGRFGTEGVAISMIANDADETMMKTVLSTFNINVEPLPDQIPNDLLNDGNDL